MKRGKNIWFRYRFKGQQTEKSQRWLAGASSVTGKFVLRKYISKGTTEHKKIGKIVPIFKVV
jgi:hypothetical protein